MIPRLPPFLLAVIGGASIYGIKMILDRLEPKAIGPPGSSEQTERLLRYRQKVRQGGIIVAATGIVMGGYWLYEQRMNRAIPAVSTSKDDGNTFYQDQYRDREAKLLKERQDIERKQKEREELAKQRLLAELVSMEERVHPDK